MLPADIYIRPGLGDSIVPADATYEQLKQKYEELAAMYFFVETWMQFRGLSICPGEAIPNCYDGVWWIAHDGGGDLTTAKHRAEGGTPFKAILHYRAMVEDFSNKRQHICSDTCESYYGSRVTSTK